MVAQVPFTWQLADTLGGMAIGLMLAVMYDLLRVFLPPLKPIIFLCDFFTFAFAAVWVFSYSVSFSRSGILRWYIILGALCGYLSYIKIISSFTKKIRKAIHFVVLFPFHFFNRKILKPIKDKIGKTVKKQQKTKRFLVKSSKKQLQNNNKMLYNSK